MPWTTLILLEPKIHGCVLIPCPLLSPSPKPSSQSTTSTESKKHILSTMTMPKNTTTHSPPTITTMVALNSTGHPPGALNTMLSTLDLAQRGETQMRNKQWYDASDNKHTMMCAPNNNVPSKLFDAMDHSPPPPTGRQSHLLMLMTYSSEYGVLRVVI
jgi:hypothetical protein